MIKVLIKVINETQDELQWEHLCYAPRKLYLKYLEKKGIERFEFADSLRAWAIRDFNVDLSMTTKKDIEVLKALVKDKYRAVYPHLYHQTRTDRYGWLRLWVTDNMERELSGR